MNKRDVTTKLAATEASLKRWQTRLKRAATMVHELDRKRRRYQLEVLSAGQPVIATVRVKKARAALHEAKEQAIAAIADTPPGSLAEKYAQQNAALIDAAIEVDIPSFLDRSDPLIAERMTAARKKAEEEARHKMPLSGKAAMAAIMAVPVTPKKPRKRKG